MKTLVFVRGALSAPVANTRFVLLDATVPSPDRDDAMPVADLVGGGDDGIEEAAAAWTKAFGRRAHIEGRPLREALTWMGVPLWYFAELYLHHSTAAPGFVRTLETFARVLDIENPDAVGAFGLRPDESLLLSRLCAARGLDFSGSLPRGLPARRKPARESRWNELKAGLSALKHGATGGPPRRPERPGRACVLFLSHAAFWTPAESGEPEEWSEHYFGRLIPALKEDPAVDCVVVAVGPRSAHRRRRPTQRLADWLLPDRLTSAYIPVNRFTTPRVVRETARAAREIRAAHTRLIGDPSLTEAFSHRGVRFDDLCADDLSATMLLQLPWAVRSMEEAREILAWSRPAVLVLYAESSGWGRAALAAARAAGVKSVGVQHGILYPHYFSYLHKEDETDCPIPDLTAVFGEEARRLLIEMGRYPENRIVITGSPKFDSLLERSRKLKPSMIRDSLGLSNADALVLVASRFRPIRDTHQAIGTAFPELVRAVESMDGVAALVKPHPAEPKEPYEEVLKRLGSRNVGLVNPTQDLGALLVASDVLVTVESLSAVEALVVGRPVVVLNMPTNLRSLVESGAALGVPAGADPRPVLERALFDEPSRKALEAARRRYLDEVARGVDGQATRRLVELVRKTALSPGVVPS